MEVVSQLSKNTLFKFVDQVVASGCSMFFDEVLLVRKRNGNELFYAFSVEKFLCPIHAML